MQQASEAIERFFRNYESNASSDDTEAVISQFADVFMAASPQGAQAVRLADFALALPKRKQLFDSLGCRLTETCDPPRTASRRPLRDGRHAMEDDLRTAPEPYTRGGGRLGFHCGHRRPS